MRLMYFLSFLRFYAFAGFALDLGFEGGSLSRKRLEDRT